MTDQNAQTQAHTFTEAPASWNVKYTLRGYECMLTIRAESGVDLMPQTLKVIDWLTKNNAVPGRAQPNGHIPAPEQPSAPAPKPAQPQPSAGAPAGEQHAYEVIEVNTITHVVTESGHHTLKVKGGKYSKFGVKAWEEVIPAEGWQTWEIGQEFAPPENMRFATVQDGKKVSAFRSTQTGN